jgi:predicted nucleic acid-binding protein
LILADTSIWIDHFRAGNREMLELLDQGQIAVHPLIVAELALGSLQDRASTLGLVDLLPHVRVARPEEVRAMIETRRLYSVGIGLIDAHLIASSFLDPPIRLWTKDKRLRKVAEDLGVHTNLV